MTIKLNDLQDFIKHIHNKIYPKKVIHITRLRFLIAEKFGISDYIQGNIINKLVEFNFLVPGGLNVYEICVDPEKDKEERQKDARKKAEAEADSLLKKVGSKHGTDKP